MWYNNCRLKSNEDITSMSIMVCTFWISFVAWRLHKKPLFLQRQRWVSHPLWQEHSRCPCLFTTDCSLTIFRRLRDFRGMHSSRNPVYLTISKQFLSKIRSMTSTLVPILYLLWSSILGIMPITFAWSDRPLSNLETKTATQSPTNAFLSFFCQCYHHFQSIFFDICNGDFSIFFWRMNIVFRFDNFH